jgi:hypothetical protein
MPDAREDLQRLPSENLFALARNHSAAHRLLAVQLLVERASPLAGHDDIAAESRHYVLNNPAILKKIEPAAAAFAPQLPGIVDCLADVLTKHTELDRVVDEHHATHLQNHADHTERASTLESVVADNKAAHEQALREAYAFLWRDCAAKIFHLKQDHDNQIAELRVEHEKALSAATMRLALLERSLWRKAVDGLKTMKRRGLARHE